VSLIQQLLMMESSFDFRPCLLGCALSFLSNIFNFVSNNFDG
jgi:hypothetical protein